MPPAVVFSAAVGRPAQLADRGLPLPTSRILLISVAPDTSVADALRASGHEVTSAGSPAEAIASGSAAANAEVIVLDFVGPVAESIAACRLLRGTEALAALPILSITDSEDIEDRIELLEASADDVMGRPFDPLELDARVEALAVRLRRSRDLTPSDHEETSIRDGSQRRVIAVYSPKGGVGTTTVAVNLATWLATQVPGSTVIVDLDAQFGQVATHLNMTPRMTIREVAEDEATLREPGLFTAALDRHGSGLQVLGGSAQLTSGGLPQETVRTMLSTASAAFQFVVVDAGSSIDPGTETALTRATDLIVVLTPEFPAIKAVHAFAEILAGDAQGTAEVSYVLNSIFARELLRPADIEEALGTKVALTIPYDAFAFLKSVNEGVPVVLGAPKSAPAIALGRFAARLAGIASGDATFGRKSKGLAGLFGR
ncbi:MAG: response regulator [Chloroflexota bacterium]|nr:MAG: response regulator [Chloroflexota bacterium]